MRNEAGSVLRTWPCKSMGRIVSVLRRGWLEDGKKRSRLEEAKIRFET